MSLQKYKLGTGWEPTKEVIEYLLSELIDGRPLMKILEEPGMPSRASFYSFLHRDKAFRAAYDLAKDIKADLFAEKAECAIEDATTGNYFVKFGQAGLYMRMAQMSNPGRWSERRALPDPDQPAGFQIDELAQAEMLAHVRDMKDREKSGG
jgi:hypothetical protein